MKLYVVQNSWGCFGDETPYVELVEKSEFMDWFDYCSDGTLPTYADCLENSWELHCEAFENKASMVDWLLYNVAESIDCVLDKDAEYLEKIRIAEKFSGKNFYFVREKDEFDTDIIWCIVAKNLDCAMRRAKQKTLFTELWLLDKNFDALARKPWRGRWERVEG